MDILNPEEIPRATVWIMKETRSTSLMKETLSTIYIHVLSPSYFYVVLYNLTSESHQIPLVNFRYILAGKKHGFNLILNVQGLYLPEADPGPDFVMLYFLIK